MVNKNISTVGGVVVTQYECHNVWEHRLRKNNILLTKCKFNHKDSHFRIANKRMQPNFGTSYPRPKWPHHKHRELEVCTKCKTRLTNKKKKKKKKYDSKTTTLTTEVSKIDLNVVYIQTKPKIF